MISCVLRMIKCHRTAHDVTKPSHRHRNPASSTDRSRSPGPAKPETRNHVWTAPWVQEPRRDFDGRFDCGHVSGLKCGAITAGPDGVRGPVPNSRATSRATGCDGFSGSSVRPIRHLCQLFHPGIDARLNRSPVGAGFPSTRHRDPCQPGHLVVQSRPKPRGGSIA